MHQKKNHVVKRVTHLTCMKILFSDGAKNYDIWSAQDSQNTSLVAEWSSYPGKVELFSHLLTYFAEVQTTRFIPLSAPVTGCYPKWRSFFVNRVPHCYLVFTKKRLTWEEAEESCREENSHLVSITSKEEQNFIRSIIGSNAVWIGFQKKNEWQWSDG